MGEAGGQRSDRVAVRESGSTRRDVTGPSRARDPLDEVLAGLRARPRRIASKYHYDERGSELFEEITRLDEYYLTRTERALLRAWMPKWIEDLRPATLVELGAGNSEKSRILLDSMVDVGCGRAYVPVDVSADFLASSAAALRREYPSLSVVPHVADFVEPLELPTDLPTPRWIAFLGSTLGNFEEPQATDLLRRVARRLRTDDRFLLGVDLRPGPEKSTQRIERAYDDARGVTAEFSLNLLNVVNAEFGSDFDPDGFTHRSEYVAERGRIETFLVSRHHQVVRFPGGDVFHFAPGDEIWTEISAKYDRPTVDALFASSGLTVDRWIEDDERLYALVLARAD